MSYKICFTKVHVLRPPDFCLISNTCTYRYIMSFVALVLKHPIGLTKQLYNPSPYPPPLSLSLSLSLYLSLSLCLGHTLNVNSKLSIKINQDSWTSFRAGNNRLFKLSNLFQYYRMSCLVTLYHGLWSYDICSQLMASHSLHGKQRGN